MLRARRRQTILFQRVHVYIYIPICIYIYIYIYINGAREANSYKLLGIKVSKIIPAVEENVLQKMNALGDVHVCYSILSIVIFLNLGHKVVVKIISKSKMFELHFNSNSSLRNAALTKDNLTA